MKKFIYLVAPLMAVPFMMTSCKKSTLHKVGIIEGSSETLRFTDDKGKEISNKKKLTIVEGKDFTFHVEIVDYSNAADGPYITKNTMFVTVNTLPVSFDFRGETPVSGGDVSQQFTKAKITVPGKVINGDVKIGGLVADETSYIYYIPYAFGLSYTVSAESGGELRDHGEFGYVKKGKNIIITFKTAGDYYLPKKENIVRQKDSDNLDYAQDSEYEAGEKEVKLTFGSEAQELVTVSARAHGYSFLEHLEWDDIKSLSSSGYASYIFEVGETKTIKLHDDVEHELQIIGFNHDEISNGGGRKAGITFQFKTLLSESDGSYTKTIWSKTSYQETDNYNFTNSTLRQKLDKVIDLLPSDLRKNGMIESVEKQVSIYGNSGWSNDHYYSARIFALSQFETNMKKSDYALKEGTTYKYYDGHAESATDLYPLRALKDASGTSRTYWLRSPRTGSGGDAAFAIAENGSADSRGQYCRGHEYGIAPAFCI